MLIFQNSQPYMCIYPLKQHKHITQRLVTVIPSFACLYTLYNNTNINKKSHCQNAQSYMCKYLQQQHKHKHKSFLAESTVFHVYIPCTTAQTWIENLIAKTPILKFVYALYNNINIKKTFSLPKWTVLQV